MGLIGTNGAGKSTLMNALGGYVPSTGDISVLGTDVTGKTPSQRAALGLGRTFQAATLFPELTVRETVQVALEARRRVPVPGGVHAREGSVVAREEAEVLANRLDLHKRGELQSPEPQEIQSCITKSLRDQLQSDTLAQPKLLSAKSIVCCFAPRNSNC